MLAPVGGLWRHGEVLALGTGEQSAVASGAGGADLQATGRRFVRNVLNAWPEP